MANVAKIERSNRREYKYDSIIPIVNNDKLFQKWIGKVAKSTQSGRKSVMNEFIYYLHHLSEYNENKENMTDATPTKLITSAHLYNKNKNKSFENAATEEEIERLLLGDDELGDYEEILTEYKVYLYENHKPSTVKTNFHRILNFFSFNKVDVSNIETGFGRSINVKSKKAPDFTLLQKVFKSAKLRDKCIISCGVTSGMARLDIISLNVLEFEEGLIQLKDNDGKPIVDSDGNPVEVCKIQRNRGKNNEIYSTFLAPESVRLTTEYINERNNVNQSETDYLMRKVYSPNDKIFIHDKFDEKKQVIPFKESLVKDVNGKVIKHDDSIRILKPNNVTAMYWRLRKQNNIPTPEGELSTVRSHAMRHFFSNIYKKIDPDYKEHMLGHGGSEVKVTYENYDDEEGLEIYLQGLDGVTIEGSVNMITMASPSVQKREALHQAEREEDRKQIQKLEMHQEIQDIKLKYVYQVDQAKAEINKLRDTIELMGDDDVDERFDGVEHWTVTKLDYERDLKSAQNIYNQIVAKRDAEIAEIKSKYGMNEVSE